MEVRLQDLIPGDILLFSGPPESHLAAAISHFTHAPVSHAAMSWTEPGTIIEQNPPGIRLRQIRTEPPEGPVHVRRQLSPPPDITPLLDAARSAINTYAPYPNPQLYLLALILLFRKSAPGPSQQRILVRLFHRVANHITESFFENESTGDLPLIPSQFVFQCHVDAGEAFSPGICPESKNQDRSQPHRATLLEQATHQMRSHPPPFFQKELLKNIAAGPPPMPPITAEAFAKEILFTFKTKETPLRELTPELVAAIHRFSQSLYTARTGIPAEKEIVKCTCSLQVPTPGMSFLQYEAPFFITPADLLLHCSNFKTIGILN